eukprot:105272_1
MFSVSQMFSPRRSRKNKVLDRNAQNKVTETKSLLEKEDWPTAEILIEDLIRKHPGNADCCWLYGRLCAHRSKFNQAILHFQHCIQLVSNHADCYCTYGVTLGILNKYIEEQEMYNKCLEYNPDHHLCHYNYARLCVHKSDFTDAEEHYKQAIANCGQDANYYAQYGILLNKLKRKQEAQKQFELAITINPDDDKIHYRYAKLLQSMSKPNQAIFALQKACNLRPTNTEYPRLLYILENKNKRLKRKLRIKRSESISKVLHEPLVTTIGSKSADCDEGNVAEVTDTKSMQKFHPFFQRNRHTRAITNIPSEWIKRNRNPPTPPVASVRVKPPAPSHVNGSKAIAKPKTTEIERLKRQMARDKQRINDLESELLIERALQNDLQKWKRKYFDKTKQANKMEQEKTELMNTIKQLHKQSVPKIGINPRNANEHQLRLNDELCQILREDLERYMVDQRKNAKYHERADSNGQTNDKKKKKKVLSELKLFHESKAQTIRDWNEKLKKKHFSDLLEILDDKLEEEYQDDDDMDSEQIAYNILFDIVVECHAVLYTEYTKIYHKEYLNASAIDMVLMNMSIFYKLLNNPKLTSLTKRIANIISYINDKIGMIYMRISAKYVEYIHIIDKDTLYRFIVTCCEIMWSVLHYNYTIYPKTFEVNETDRKYDEIVHEREAAYKGDIIQYFAFPAIMCDKQYVTKMWIVCND